MRRRLLFPVLALAAALALVPGCLSPTLPLPPPEVPSIITAGAASGTWEVFGTCSPGALVTVFNDTTGRGVVAEDRSLSGSYHVIIEGAECDPASVMEQIGQEESAPTPFVLTTRQFGDPNDSQVCH